MKNLFIGLALAGLLLTHAGSAASPGPNQAVTQPEGAVTLVDGSISGAWFDPAFDGAGFLIEVLPNDQAVVYWFTYDEVGGQQWFIGVGDVVGTQIIIDELLITSGGRFGDAFDPSAIVNTPVGRATFDFTDCTTATVDYTVDEVSGMQSLQRLTSIKGANCNSQEKLLHTQRNQTGTWFNSGRSGEGFVVEVLDDEQVLVIWFTYDNEGEQAWFIGVGHVAAEFLHVQEMLSTSGGRFGPEHDPALVERTPWGSLELAFGCNDGRSGYDAVDPAFGSGEIPQTRLTSIEGLDCIEDPFRQAQANELIGQWQSDGFGYVAEVTETSFSVLQMTASSCLNVITSPISAFESSGDLLVNDNLGRLRVRGLDSVTPVDFDRVAQLPVMCRNGGTSFTADPVSNFQVFADTFSELYAVFPLRGVDWPSQIAAFQSMVTASTTDDQLFSIFSNMLSPLGDGHVSLVSPTRFFSAGTTTTLFNRAFRPEVNQIIEDVYLVGGMNSAANGRIRYGLMDDSIGYLELTAFFGFGMPGNSGDQNMSFYQAELDTVLDFFNANSVEAIIIDNRRNDGGDSAFGLEAASRFSRGRERLAFSERRPNASGLTDAIADTVQTSSRTTFDGPVVLMISRLTASAAEIFTFAMRSLPHATLVGEPTLGVLSRTERVLPNGWVASLTVGIVEAPDGAQYEATGIPADVFAPTFPSTDITSSRDSGLDAAIAELTNQ